MRVPSADGVYDVTMLIDSSDPEKEEGLRSVCASVAKFVIFAD
ncbi:hypothetical protein Z949_274 [Sulfitobacter guttiformis KCTC 32187]|nr:hypothetical protein Z949_274 [Sulfitobacter guttiformis KCTC 32187]